MPDDEPEEQTDILERINDNLSAMRSEMEKLNRDKLRDNLRLAVLIVVFAVPFSFIVNILSGHYNHKYAPLVGEGGWEANFAGIVIILLMAGLYLLTKKFWSPLMYVLEDSEVTDLIEKLNTERKKK